MKYKHTQRNVTISLTEFLTRSNKASPRTFQTVQVLNCVYELEIKTFTVTFWCSIEI
jgi:hypothetical protein